MRIAVALLVLAAPKAPVPAKQPGVAIAQRVQRYYERIKDFSASFAQTSSYPTFGNIKKAAGKVFLKKPDLLRWQYDDGRLIVLDGKKLWNWNPEDKEVQVKSGFGPDQVPPEFAFLFGKGKLLDRFDVRAVPRPIYTEPEIAAVGLTEAEAREQYGDEVAVGQFPWIANARAVMQDETVGWVKSIHETRYGELLGIVMVGPHVTDLIEAGVVAIDAESTVETVADGVAPHPTLSEAIKEAGLVALGRAIHVPNRKPRAKAKA